MKQLIESLGQFSQLKRIRIHTRLPVVIPQRITDALCQLLGSSALTPVMVLHINHANEISPLFREKMEKIRAYVQVCKDDFIKTLDQNVELNLAANDLLHHWKSEDKTHNEKLYDEILREMENK